MNKKFNLLYSLSYTLKILGVVLFFVGIYVFVLMFERSLPMMANIGLIAMGFLLVAFGVLFCFLSESIHVFFAIEENVRRMTPNSEDSQQKIDKNTVTFKIP